MGIAFDCDPPEMADFTRMHVPQVLCITRVKHKTYADVNEKGTEAAAVTAVEMEVTIRENLPGTISMWAHGRRGKSPSPSWAGTGLAQRSSAGIFTRAAFARRVCAHRPSAVCCSCSASA